MTTANTAVSDVIAAKPPPSTLTGPVSLLSLLSCPMFGALYPKTAGLGMECSRTSIQQLVVKMNDAIMVENQPSAQQHIEDARNARKE